MISATHGGVEVVYIRKLTEELDFNQVLPSYTRIIMDVYLWEIVDTSKTVLVISICVTCFSRTTSVTRSIFKFERVDSKNLSDS